MGNDLIRMSGMNSGLDTESIIKALTANSKLKVTKQERNVLKYEATQEAYRDIIGKMQNIKSKYFDLLNKDSYLSGTSMWSKYTSKTYDNEGNEKNIKGLSVTTTINSKAGDYDFYIESEATQTKLTGTKLGGNANINFNGLENQFESDGVTPKTYGITVTVGDTEKNITFASGATKEETIDNLNEQLELAFGESNESVKTHTGSDSYKDFEGMVYADRNGNIVSRDSKGVTTSGLGTMEKSNTLNLAAAKSGTNTLSIQVGDKTLNVSFQTIEKTYFDSAISAGLIDTSTGEVVPSDKTENGERVWYTKAKNAARAKLSEGGATPTDEEVETEAAKIESEWSNAVSVYKETVEDYKESVRYAKFKEYVGDGTDNTKMDALYADALNEQKKKQIGKWLAADSDINTKYENYKNDLASDVEADDIYTWAKAQSSDSDIQTKVTKSERRYDGYGDGENDYTDDYYTDGYNTFKDNFATAALSDEQKAAYQTYKSEKEANNETAKSIYEWAETENSDARTAVENAKTAEGSNWKEFDEWKTDKIESDSWHLSRSSFDDSESEQFAAYKRTVYNEETATYDLSADNIYDHFTESSVKNTIGKLEADGIKFEAAYAAGSDSVTISAKNADGTDAAFSITVGKESANKADAFGLSTSSDATTQISQVTNTTKLSDIMDSTGSGTFDFTINGQTFSFDGNTTVNDMMKKVNASSAGVKMSYSSLQNQFSITTSAYGVDSKLEISDTSGLLKQIGLESSNIVRGTNLKVTVNDETYESAGNTIEADGTTFTLTGKHEAGEAFTVSVSQDTSAIADVIKDFVKDYNQLIEDVYKMLDEKPEKDYYFLADQDKEDLELSEKQEEKWEEKAKKGLLYHDSTTTQIMSKLRTALMGSVEGLDGNRFSLLDLGIKTASDYNQHGKLTLDATKLTEAIEAHGDDIMKLFSDSESGIMKQFSDALDSGINTNGDDKGTLIKKAGLASGTSSTDNEIYRAIKRTKTKITDLNRRYESEQDRLWKRYSNMESLLGQMNSQQSSFMSYFAQ